MKFNFKSFIRLLPILGGIIGLIFAAGAVTISIFYLQNKKLPFTDLAHRFLPIKEEKSQEELSAISIDYTTLEKLAKDHPQGETFLAEIHTNEGYIKDEIPGNDFGAYMAIGFALRQLGDNRGAAASYTRALQINPQNVVTLNNLAISYVDLGEYEKAEYAYRAITEINPENIPSYRNLADIYWYKIPEKRGEIPKLIETGLTHRPEHPDLLVYLAIYYKNIGDIPKAIEYFERTIKANPENAAARQELEDLRKK